MWQDQHFWKYIFVTLAAVPFLRRKNGHIIVVSPTTAFVPHHRTAMYQVGFLSRFRFLKFLFRRAMYLFNSGKYFDLCTCCCHHLHLYLSSWRYDHVSFMNGACIHHIVLVSGGQGGSHWILRSVEERSVALWIGRHYCFHWTHRCRWGRHKLRED